MILVLNLNEHDEVHPKKYVIYLFYVYWFENKGRTAEEIIDLSAVRLPIAGVRIKNIYIRHSYRAEISCSCKAFDTFWRFIDGFLRGRTSLADASDIELCRSSTEAIF